jgi:hypothetical protein
MPKLVALLPQSIRQLVCGAIMDRIVHTMVVPRGICGRLCMVRQLRGWKLVEGPHDGLIASRYHEAPTYGLVGRARYMETLIVSHGRSLFQGLVR